MRFAPYARVEFYHDSQYKKWNQTAIDIGPVFPLHKRMEFEMYLEHQNNTSTPPDQQTNALGIVLSLYF